MSTNTFIRTTENLGAFYRQFPLDFFFLDEEGKAQLYILDERIPGKTHHLIIANESERDLTISDGTPLASLTPGPDNYHFELRFRPGVLSPGHFRWINVGSSDWRLHTVQWSGTQAREAGMEPGTISLYLLYIVPLELVLGGEDSILLPLHGIKAGQEGGSRGSRVELRYQLLEADRMLVADPGAADAQLQYRQERLNILNRQGIKDIPLHASFKGTGTVLNDGESANTLRLQVSSLLRNDYLPFSERNLAAPTRFVLSFDTSEQAECWALTDHDNAAAMDLSVSMTGDRGLLWHIEKETQGQTPQWILSVIEDTRLNPGEQFTIEIRGLITSMPSGLTQLYLQYENIPGYWDGMLKAVIEKSPIQYQDEYGVGDNVVQTKLGIGTNDPQQVLDVNGSIRAHSIDLERGIESMGFNGSLEGNFNGNTNIEMEAHNGTLTFNGGVKSIQTGTGGTSKIELAGGSGHMYLHGSVIGRHLASGSPKLQLDTSTGNMFFFGSLNSRQSSNGQPRIKLDANTGQVTFKSKVASSKKDSSGNSVAELDGDHGMLRVSSKIKLGRFEMQEKSQLGKNFLELTDTSEPSQKGGFIPTGGIIMWSGSTPPNGWAICDGLNGTPDLRGRFIVGKSDTSSATRGYSNSERTRSDYRTVGNHGGAYSVRLSLSQMPSHNHDNNYNEYPYNRLVRFNQSGEKESYNGGGSGNTNRFNLRWHAPIMSAGGNQSHENRPPYYVLAFIMKL